jgi:hypothetical protein
MTLITGTSENNGIDIQRSKTVSSNKKFEAGPKKNLPNYSKKVSRKTNEIQPDQMIPFDDDDEDFKNF